MYYNQTTTQHLLHDFDINKYYICVVLWLSLLKSHSIPHIIGDPRRTRSAPSDNQTTPQIERAQIIQQYVTIKQ